MIFSLSVTYENSQPQSKTQSRRTYLIKRCKAMNLQKEVYVETSSLAYQIYDITYIPTTSEFKIFTSSLCQYFSNYFNCTHLKCTQMHNQTDTQQTCASVKLTSGLVASPARSCSIYSNTRYKLPDTLEVIRPSSVMTFG